MIHLDSLTLEDFSFQKHSVFVFYVYFYTALRSIYCKVNIFSNPASCVGRADLRANSWMSAGHTARLLYCLWNVKAGIDLRRFYREWNVLWMIFTFLFFTLNQGYICCWKNNARLKMAARCSWSAQPLGGEWNQGVNISLFQWLFWCWVEVVINF